MPFVRMNPRPMQSNALAKSVTQIQVLVQQLCAQVPSHIQSPWSHLKYFKLYCRFLSSEQWRMWSKCHLFTWSWNECSGMRMQNRLYKYGFQFNCGLHRYFLHTSLKFSLLIDNNLFREFSLDSCQVNNGGCDPCATCSHDAATNSVVCTCKTGYTNTGSDSTVVCTGKIEFLRTLLLSALMDTFFVNLL